VVKDLQIPDRVVIKVHKGHKPHRVQKVPQHQKELKVSKDQRHPLEHKVIKVRLEPRVSKGTKVQQDQQDLEEIKVLKVTLHKEVKEHRVLRSKDPKDLPDRHHRVQKVSKDPKALRVI
jgi:hypothetical protein